MWLWRVITLGIRVWQCQKDSGSWASHLHHKAVDRNRGRGDDCARLVAQIVRKLVKLNNRKIGAKFDPANGFTLRPPGPNAGHLQAISELENGIKKDMDRFDRQCSDLPPPPPISTPILATQWNNYPLAGFTPNSAPLPTLTPVPPGDPVAAGGGDPTSGIMVAGIAIILVMTAPLWVPGQMIAG